MINRLLMYCFAVMDIRDRAFLICVMMVACSGVTFGKDRPNVLFIAVDDLRPELGCYGVRDVHSPNIDRLAKTAATFELAYCQVAVCNPSRVSIMTGLRPDSTKVWDLVTQFRETVPHAVTLPQHFRKHGYHAVSYGKIFHNPWPDNESWDEPHRWPKSSSLWSEEAKRSRDEFRKQMRAAGKSETAVQRMRAVATEVVDIDDSEHIDGAIADQALKAMRRLANGEKPFFLATGFVRPHLPFVVPRKYWEMYDRATIPLAPNAFIPKGSPDFAMNTMYELRDYMDFATTLNPRDGTLTEEQQRRLKHGYYASVSFVDALVGRLMNELDGLGLAQNTIVVLWGDHGWKLGEHNSWCKQTNYEIDARVPLILKVPGELGDGIRPRVPVELLDVYPTLCEVAGIPSPSHVEGRSLVPLITGAPTAETHPAFSQFRRSVDGMELMGYAMRTTQYRYVEWLNRESRNLVAVELYDHIYDSAENNNLADDVATVDVRSQLHELMWSRLPKPPPSASSMRTRNRSRATFQNASKKRLLVFWLPENGERRQIGEISVGGSLRQNTQIGHRFRVESTDGEFAQTIQIRKRTQVVVLSPEETTSTARRPNIVVIMGDDWSWPHAGILGDPVVRTPTFDRIANEGTLFRNAFVSSPSCTPSRFAVATGQYHWRLGGGDSLGGSLATDVPVYPELLAEEGYLTGFSRKGASPSKHIHRGTDPFGSRYKSFNDFMEERIDGQPFCYWYGAGEPHRPYDWKASDSTHLDESRIKVPPFLPDSATVRTDLGDYYLRVEKLDRLAGQIVKRLEDDEELDNTILIMAGDNGMPFPRCKATLYDMGTHVPLAIRWAARTKDGVAVDDMVSLTDLAPTILEAAGQSVPEVMTGRSLMPQLAAKSSGIVEPTRDHVLTGREKHVYARPSRAIRTARYLYIRNYSPRSWPTGEVAGESPKYDFARNAWPTKPPAFSFDVDPSPTKQWMLQNGDHPETATLIRLAFGERPTEELYEIATDPFQITNVALKDQFADVRRRLHQQLVAELKASGDPRAMTAYKLK